MQGRILAAALAALVSGCGTFAGTIPSNPSREVLGVTTQEASRADGAAVDAAAVRRTDWEASQICTTGIAPVKQDVEPAERDEQLVDQLLRCRPYGFSVLGVSLARVVPLSGFAPSYDSGR